METDLFGNPDSPNTTKNAAAEAAKATRKAAPKDQASPLAERLRPKTVLRQRGRSSVNWRRVCWISLILQ